MSPAERTARDFITAFVWTAFILSIAIFFVILVMVAYRLGAGS